MKSVPSLWKRLLAALLATAIAALSLFSSVPAMAVETEESVEFTFLSPATRVILDGEPLLILPDTLTARLAYVDENGSQVEETIRYTSDALRTGASWSALKRFLGSDGGALDPLYDSAADTWYYEILGTRYDVPMQEVEMTDADAVELDYEYGFDGISDEWVQGTVRLYRVTPTKAMLFDDLHMNQTPSDSSYISRGSKKGGAMTFSKEDSADASSRRTEAGESFYYASLYYGEKSRLLVDCRPACEEVQSGDPEYRIVVDEVNRNGKDFKVTSILPAEGWYRVWYEVIIPGGGSPNVRIAPMTSDREIKTGIFERNLDAYNLMTDRSEPMYLPRGYTEFQSKIYATNPSGYYEEVVIEATVEKLEAGDITIENLGIVPYGEHRDPWSCKLFEDYSYGREPLFFAPAEWEDYDFQYPSPASLAGRTDEDCLSFKCLHYMKRMNGNKEVYPFSFRRSVKLREMELTDNQTLRYSFSDFGWISAQLLDPSGNPMDLTSTAELTGGRYTLHITSQIRDTLAEEQNIPICIPPRNRQEILHASDISISYDEGKSDFAYDFTEFVQSTEDPDEYSLTISCSRHEFSLYSDLLEPLSIQATYQQTLTELIEETYHERQYVTDMVTKPSTMEEIVIAMDELYDWQEGEPCLDKAWLGDPYTDETDSLEVHLYDKDLTIEYTEPYQNDLAPGEYLMTVTSGLHGFEKKIHITLQGYVEVQSISLSETELHLRPNETRLLLAEITPPNASQPQLTWETEDSEIAYVKDGLITGYDEGTTTVTAFAEDGTVSASCIVHVARRGIDQLTFTKSEVTLHPQETMQLTYTMTPADNDYPEVAWESDNTSIVNVNGKGEVTAEWAYGDANITLYAQDGQVKATCRIHVVPYPVREIKLLDEQWETVSNGGSLEICVGSAGALPVEYWSDAVRENAFLLEAEDLKDFSIQLSNSNPKVLKTDFSDSSCVGYSAERQGQTVLTITAKGNGWEKKASFTVRVLFDDVLDHSRYYFNPVYWAAQRGITNGYGGWNFGVGDSCTREDMVTFLWRMQNKPPVSAADKKKYHFSDVASGSYYENAVVWAAKNGITKGYSSGALKGKFGVGQNVTREDAVTFLYRVAGKPSVSSADRAKYKFSDIKSKAYYAIPVAWAAKNGITKGYSSGALKGKFGVGQNVKREDIVTFMYRYDRL